MSLISHCCLLLKIVIIQGNTSFPKILQHLQLCYTDKQYHSGQATGRIGAADPLGVQHGLESSIDPWQGSCVRAAASARLHPEARPHRCADRPACEMKSRSSQACSSLVKAAKHPFKGPSLHAQIKNIAGVKVGLCNSSRR